MNKIFIFVLGAAVGSFATWKFVENKYKRIAQEEIDSVKETFSRIKKEQPSAEEVAEYETIVDNYISNDMEKEGEHTKEINEEDYEVAPYVIAPEQYGEKEDYDTVTYTYYAGDGVLADYVDNPIDDYEDFLGKDPFTHFGEFEDDSVYIRNEARETDYEILLDIRSYNGSIYQVTGE
jgi:hypothetical protein